MRTRWSPQKEARHWWQSPTARSCRHSMHRRPISGASDSAGAVGSADSSVGTAAGAEGTCGGAGVGAGDT